MSTPQTIEKHSEVYNKIKIIVSLLDVFFLPWIHEVNLTEICKTTYKATNRFHENCFFF